MSKESCKSWQSEYRGHKRRYSQRKSELNALEEKERSLKERHGQLESQKREIESQIAQVERSISVNRSSQGEKKNELERVRNRMVDLKDKWDWNDCEKYGIGDLDDGW